MRPHFAAFLLLATSLSASSGCRGSREPDGGVYGSVELHVWNRPTAKKGKRGKKRAKAAEQYWVTRLDPRTGCLAQRYVDPGDGITHDLRDCSLASLIQPRIAELVAVFELDGEPFSVGERVDTRASNEGHAVVFERGDGTRWTSDSKLLRAGAELLDRELAELLLVGPAPTTPPPTPAGWAELRLRDTDEVFERQLGSDGRWSCESWIMSESSLEHFIVTRRGRIDPSEAAALLDGFAEGVITVSLDEASEWRVALTPAGEGDVLTARSKELTALWDAFAVQLDPACRLDPPPTLSEL